MPWVLGDVRTKRSSPGSWAGWHSASWCTLPWDISTHRMVTLQLLLLFSPYLLTYICHKYSPFASLYLSCRVIFLSSVSSFPFSLSLSLPFSLSLSLSLSSLWCYVCLYLFRYLSLPLCLSVSLSLTLFLFFLLLHISLSPSLPASLNQSLYILNNSYCLILGVPVKKINFELKTQVFQILRGNKFMN